MMTSFVPMEEESGAVSGTFTFRRRWANVDWRALSGIDVDKIAQTVDVQTLQKNILHVTFCNVENEEFRNVDINFIKLFRLSQLIIEYLLHTQQYLTDQLQVLQEQLHITGQELQSTRNEVTTQSKNLKTVKKENRKRRKMIESYQQMINAGATGLYPCHICHREFISSEFLKGHIERRHATKPQDEAKVLKEMEKDLEAKLFEKVQQQLLQSKNEMKQELLLKESQLHEKKVKEFEEWKTQEQQRLKEELVFHKTTLTTQLEEQNQHTTDLLQKTLEQAQEELKALRTSREQSMEIIPQAVCAHDTRVEETEKMTDLQNQFHSQLQQSVKEERRVWKTKLKEAAKKYKEDLMEKTRKYEEELRESQGHIAVLEQSLTTVPKDTSTVKQLAEQVTQINTHLTELKESQASQPQIIVSSQPSSSSSSSSSPSASDNEQEDGSGRKDEELLKLKTALNSIVNEAMTKRGVEPSSGLTSQELNDKMKLLKQEQESKAQTHPLFVQQRSELEKQVEEQIKLHYKSAVATTPKKPPVAKIVVTPPPATPIKITPTATPIKSPTKLSVQSSSDEESTDDDEEVIPITSKRTAVDSSPLTTISRPSGMIASLTSTVPATTVPSMASVPFTVTSVSSAVPSIAGTAPVATSIGRSLPVTSVRLPPNAVPVLPVLPVASVSLQPVTSVTPLTGVPSSSVPVSMMHMGTNATTTAVNTAPASRLSLPDSDSDDSIEQLIANSNVFAKASSTPIKSVTVVERIDQNKSQVGVVPVGGAPVMMIPQPLLDPLESDDSDTFTISELSVAPPTAPPISVSKPISVQSVPLMSSKHDVHHVTAVTSSHSALTTVTADDFDSDISDITELK